MPAGYPKVVEGRAYPGLPAGKVALVGMCSIGDGGIANNDALPGLKRALVDAPGVTAACLQSTARHGWWEFDGDAEVKLGERTLNLALFFDEQGINRKARARAYLREADGTLVSIATDELDLAEINENDCKATLKKNKSGAAFKVFCKLGTPDRCKKNPWWSFSQTIRVAGDKVTIQHTEKSSPGDDCEPTYE